MENDTQSRPKCTPDHLLMSFAKALRWLLFTCIFGIMATQGDDFWFFKNAWLFPASPKISDLVNSYRIFFIASYKWQILFYSQHFFINQKALRIIILISFLSLLSFFFKTIKKKKSGRVWLYTSKHIFWQNTTINNLIYTYIDVFSNHL